MKRLLLSRIHVLVLDIYIFFYFLTTKSQSSICIIVVVVVSLFVVFELGRFIFRSEFVKQQLWLHLSMNFSRLLTFNL
jgi:hypothetical protein